MARYYGRVGFGDTVETRPGVMEDVIIERKFFGDVLPPSSKSLEEGDKVNRDSKRGDRISILATDYLNENIDAIRFVEYRNVLWQVTRIEEKRPRLIFSLGEVYNGPVATTDPANI